jgi:hypothetical protein
MNDVPEVPQTVARTSPHHAKTLQQPRVHRTGGLREMLWGTRLVLVLRRYLYSPSMGRHGMEKSEHCQHQGGLAHPLGLRVQGIGRNSLSLRTQGGLSTFGDSLPARALFIEGFGLMSWGTLHRGSRIKKIVNDETYL